MKTIIAKLKFINDEYENGMYQPHPLNQPTFECEASISLIPINGKNLVSLLIDRNIEANLFCYLDTVEYRLRLSYKNKEVELLCDCELQELYIHQHSLNILLS